jgi:integrase
MSTDLARLRQQEIVEIDLDRLVKKAVGFISNHLSDSTKRAYAHDFDTYELWCEAINVKAMPANPQYIALYIAALADEGLAVSSIERALAAISKAHETAKLHFNRKDPDIKHAMTGVRKTLGVRPNRVDAITPAELTLMVKSQPTTNYRGIRNRAILTFGFAGAFRRSELAALNVSDLTRVRQGFRVLIRKSKTDQESAGQEIGIPQGEHLVTCPVQNMLNWIEVRGMKPKGPLFCGMNLKATELYPTKRVTGRLIARTVQGAQRAAGIEDRWFAGHSLRAGLVTSAAIAGKPMHAIQATTRHKNVEMIMRYIRKEGLFNDNAAEGIGL